MSNKIVIHPLENVAAALEAAVAANEPISTIRTKSADKNTGPATYINLNFAGRGITSSTGGLWASSDSPITITKGPLNPDDKTDKRAKYGLSYSMAISSTVSNSGVFGRFMLAWDAYCRKFFAKFVEAAPALKGPVIHWPVKTEFTKETTDEKTHAKTNTTEVSADPFINLKFRCGEKDKYSDKYPVTDLRGKPRTELLDFSKMKIEGNQRIYDPLLIQEKKQMVRPNERNMFKAIKEGMTIRKYRVCISGIVISASGISFPVDIARAVIDTSIASSFDEDKLTADELAASTPSTSSAVPTSSTATTTTSAPVAPTVKEESEQVASTSDNDGEDEEEEDADKDNEEKEEDDEAEDEKSTNKKTAIAALKTTKRKK